MSHPAGSLPQGRYGRSHPAGRGSRSTWDRAKGWIYTAVALVVATAAALIAYQNLGSEEIGIERLGFDIQDTAGEATGAVEITVRVDRDEPANDAVCIVRARDDSGAESGRKELYVPAADGDVVLSTVIRSHPAPITADAFACSYVVPEYLE